MQSIDLSPLHHITVSGPDAKSFLQGQLTCDLMTLEHNKITLGAYCDLKGRMVSLFHLYQHQEHYYLVMPQSLISLTAQTLNRYKLRAKVTISTDQATQTRLGIIAEAAELKPSWQSLAIGDIAVEQEVVIIRHRGDQPRFELIGSPAMLDQYLSTQELDATTPFSQWQLADIHAGQAFLDPSTAGLFLPQEVDLQKLGGVSFNKGCFLGQEVIARLHYRGKLKKVMQSITLDIPGTPGEILYNQQHQKIGQLICQANQDSYTTALCLVDRTSL